MLTEMTGDILNVKNGIICHQVNYYGVMGGGVAAAIADNILTDDQYTERCKLFVSAASEMFPPDMCHGDEGLYQQLEWYKDVRNRVRTDHKGGGIHWYWTGSARSGDSRFFCFVSSYGDTNSNNASSAFGLAPFGFVISKT